MIGLELDEDALRAELEACLLTDVELAAHEEAVHAAQVRWRERRTHRNATLRFDVGETVECHLGADLGWIRGVVVAHDFRAEDWESGKVMPYQVRMSPEGAISGSREGCAPYDGMLICAPADTERIIRAHDPTHRHGEHCTGHAQVIMGETVTSET